jgi:hypothetical protein
LAAPDRCTGRNSGKGRHPRRLDPLPAREKSLELSFRVGDSSKTHRGSLCRTCSGDHALPRRRQGPARPRTLPPPAIQARIRARPPVIASGRVDPSRSSEGGVSRGRALGTGQAFSENQSLIFDRPHPAVKGFNIVISGVFLRSLGATLMIPGRRSWLPKKCPTCPRNGFQTSENKLKSGIGDSRIGRPKSNVNQSRKRYSGT